MLSSKPLHVSLCVVPEDNSVAKHCTVIWIILSTSFTVYGM